MKIHCCDMMDALLDESKASIFYSPKAREYSIGMRNSKIVRQSICYCPWCGAKLPTSLRDEFFNILRNEYGLDIDIFETEKAPKEFQTDEWWRKREL